MLETKPTQARVISTFVDKMMADKGLGSMSAEEQAKTKKDLSAQVEEHVERALLAALSDSQLSELERLVDDGASDANDTALNEFFQKTGIDYTKVASQAMADFRREYLNNARGEM